jgi:hypothetical protein
MNKVTFEEYQLRFAVVTIFTVYSFINYWASLYGADDVEKLRSGAKKLMTKAIYEPDS